VTHRTLTQDDEPYVKFCHSEGSIKRILVLLADDAEFGMSSNAAQVLKGKLSFVLQSAWGRARAATQPLATRSGSSTNTKIQPRDDGISWTTALENMRDPNRGPADC